MKKRTHLALGAALMTMLLAAPGQAVVDWSAGPAIMTKNEPLDTAITLDGKWTFVLTTGGAVQVYGEDGVLNDTIPVDPSTSHLALTGSGSKLILSSQRAKTVQQLDIAFVASIDIKDAPSLGPSQAPVEIVVFSDFQCPYCSKVGELIENILEKNPKTVKVAFKHFPLGFHQYAQNAATAAVAAQAQGKFWEFHDLLFQNNKELTDDKINGLAKQLGLNMKRFKADMASAATLERVTRDMEDGRRAGVQGTPTIFINGRSLKDRSPQGMQMLVDKELARLSKGKQDK